MPTIELFNEDCMEVMKRYPDKYFDLACVDPPYGINVANNTTGTVIRNKSDRDIFKKKEWDKAIPDNAYFDELMRVSKEQIIWGGNYFLDILGYCKAPIIWGKLNGASMYADGEMAWTSRGLPRNLRIWKHQWCGAFKDSDRTEPKIHPTQKPTMLYQWILTNYAKPGQRILDTHLGSGSSAIAAHNLGFDLVGMELDKDYYNAACKRLKDHQTQQTLFSPFPLADNYEQVDLLATMDARE